MRRHDAQALDLRALPEARLDLVAQARAGKLGVRLVEMTSLSLTFDHRVVNGAPAAAFLDRLCQTIASLPPISSQAPLP